MIYPQNTNIAALHTAGATVVRQLADGTYEADINVSPQQLLALTAEAEIPTVVTMRQARLALLNAGLLTSVNNAIAALTGPPAAADQINWEFATTVDRNSPLVASMSASLNLTSAQLDSLFTAAALL